MPLRIESGGHPGAAVRVPSAAARGPRPCAGLPAAPERLQPLADHAAGLALERGHAAGQELQRAALPVCPPVHACRRRAAVLFPGSGHPVPRRRAGRGVAAVRGAAADRRRAVRAIARAAACCDATQLAIASLGQRRCQRFVTGKRQDQSFHGYSHVLAPRSACRW